MDQRVDDLLTGSQSTLSCNTWLCCENSEQGTTDDFTMVPDSIHKLSSSPPLERGLELRTRFQWEEKTQRKCRDGIAKVRLQSTVSSVLLPLSLAFIFVLMK